MVNSLKFFTFVVWTNVLICLLNEDTCSKLDIESIIDSSFDVLFPFIDERVASFFINIFITLFWIIIIRLSESYVVLFEIVYKLGGDFAVSSLSIFYYLFHNFERKILKSCWEFVIKVYDFFVAILRPLGCSLTLSFNYSWSLLNYLILRLRLLSLIKWLKSRVIPIHLNFGCGYWFIKLYTL